MAQADITFAGDWQTLHQRFTAYRILFEADDQWGPLAISNGAAAATDDLRRMTTGPDRAEWEGEFRKEQSRQEAELARHMRTIYDPLLEAGMALVRCPAPDLAAVQVKHEACNADGFRLIDFENEEGELFGIIRADIARLTGIEA